MTSEIDALIRELENASARLRSGEMEADEAAGLVERCAELAGRVGAELDRAAREADREAPGDGQEQLL
jgi:hypothetical protein